MKNINFDASTFDFRNFNKDAVTSYFDRARNDSAAFFFNTSDLEYLVSSFVTQFKIPMSSYKFIPVNENFSGLEEWISTEVFTGFGEAKLISEYADDIEQGTFTSSKQVTGVKSFGIASIYSKDDIERARRPGQSLPTFKLEYNVQAVRRAMNNAAWLGIAEANVPGLLNNASVPKSAAAGTGSGAGTATRNWNNKTFPQIVFDVQSALNAFRILNGFEATHMILPHSKYLLLNNSFFPNTNVFASEQITEANPSLLIDWADELKGSYLDTDGQYYDQMVIYNKEASGIQQAMVLPPQILPEQVTNLTHKVIVRSKFGGTIIPNPNAVSFVYGI